MCTSNWRVVGRRARGQRRATGRTGVRSRPRRSVRSEVRFARRPCAPARRPARIDSLGLLAPNVRAGVLRDSSTRAHRGATRASPSRGGVARGVCHTPEKVDDLVRVARCAALARRICTHRDIQPTGRFRRSSEETLFADLPNRSPDGLRSWRLRSEPRDASRALTGFSSRAPRATPPRERSGGCPRRGDGATHPRWSTSETSSSAAGRLGVQLDVLRTTPASCRLQSSRQMTPPSRRDGPRESASFLSKENPNRARGVPARLGRDCWSA